jgi:DNA-binding GntR family transcriptional regulator
MGGHEHFVQARSVIESSQPEILPRTRAEAIASDLRRAIFAGTHPPGSRLRQAEIASRYNVSTTPVREAFTALAREGLVTQGAHRGVVVFEPSLDELNEIYEIRTALEPLATRLAVPNLAAADLDELAALVRAMGEAEPAEYQQLNYRFHSRIYVAAARPRLLDIISTLRETSASYTGIGVRRFDQAYHDQVHREHEAILEALRDGAAQRAARLVRSHLKHNQRHVAKLVARRA